MAFVGVQWRLLAFSGVCWRSVAFGGVCWRSVAFVGVCWLLSFSETRIIDTGETTYFSDREYMSIIWWYRIRIRRSLSRTHSQHNADDLIAMIEVLLFQRNVGGKERTNHTENHF